MLPLLTRPVSNNIEERNEVAFVQLSTTHHLRYPSDLKDVSKIMVFKYMTVNLHVMAHLPNSLPRGEAWKRVLLLLVPAPTVCWTVFLQSPQ